MSSENIVKLDIGGTVFKTTKSTLTKFDGFFKVMLDTDVPLKKDDAGCIFIDRSPKHFERILNFMRNGHVIFPKSLEDILEIQEEAQFYLLTGLSDMCDSKIPADLPVKLRIIESDDQMLQIIANSKEKPVVIIFYYVGANEFDPCPPSFIFEDFLKEYENRFDIYFKHFHKINYRKDHETVSTFRIHFRGKTHSGPLKQLKTFIKVKQASSYFEPCKRLRLY